MSNKLSTVPIVFHGGTYGTYLEWCLTNLCSNDSIISPFTETGSSHKFYGNHVKDMKGWHYYCRTNQDMQFVRFHPKTKKDENLSDNLNKVISQVNKTIYIYPDPDSVLLTINNYYSKIWNDWWSNQFINEIDQNKIYKNWPISADVPISDIPIWIKREFLSLYLVPAWQDQVEWNHLKSWSDSRCHVVLVKDLLHNFKETIESIEDFCQLNFQRPVSDLVKYHQENIKLQKFINQDSVCGNIIQSIFSSKPFQWDTLPLPSEAWIQWQLRNHGFELRCHELDIFPTNSVQLKELLYSV